WVRATCRQWAKAARSRTGSPAAGGTPRVEAASITPSRRQRRREARVLSPLVAHALEDELAGEARGRLAPGVALPHEPLVRLDVDRGPLAEQLGYSGLHGDAGRDETREELRTAAAPVGEEAEPLARQA